MQKSTTLTAVPRGSGAPAVRTRGPFEFRYFALLTVIATYGLIVLGGIVRATDSGTACPDWPLCYGNVLPRLESHVLIEYSHRVAASIVGFIILGAVVWAWRGYRDDRIILRAATVAGVLLVAQVLVGAATVDTETAASAVALHLSVALTLLASLIVLAVAAFQPEPTRMPTRLPLMSTAAALATLVLIISGAYVSQTGAGLAYPDWPLFDGKLVSAGGKLADLHYAHRLIAAFVGVFVVVMAVRTGRSESRPVVRVAVGVAFALYLAQVLVGASNVWLELATSVRITHLALASALWGVLVFSVAWAVLSPAHERGT